MRTNLNVLAASMGLLGLAGCADIEVDVWEVRQGGPRTSVDFTIHNNARSERVVTVTCSFDWESPYSPVTYAEVSVLVAGRSLEDNSVLTETVSRQLNSVDCRPTSWSQPSPF